MPWPVATCLAADPGDDGDRGQKRGQKREFEDGQALAAVGARVDDPADLGTCERGRLHLGGQIQGVGALPVRIGDGGEVVVAAGNCATVRGLEVDETLGTRLVDRPPHRAATPGRHTGSPHRAAIVAACHRDGPGCLAMGRWEPVRGLAHDILTPPRMISRTPGRLQARGRWMETASPGCAR